ncbi:MAG TPA: guanylate kinase, partial [Pirellulaceae bacterium]
FSSGEWYGTLYSEVREGLEAGKSVILEIDVRGALRVMEQRPDVVSIFIQPVSNETLESRLRGRGTESEEVIQRRLERSRRERASADRYDDRVVNDESPRATREICEIIHNRSQLQHAR